MAFPICDCTIGDEVVLSDPDPQYTIGNNNPKVGTEWECVGVISEIGFGSVIVEWSNGCSNSYKDYELSYSKDNKCFDIWENMHSKIFNK